MKYLKTGLLLLLVIIMTISCQNEVVDKGDSEIENNVKSNVEGGVDIGMYDYHNRYRVGILCVKVTNAICNHLDGSPPSWPFNYHDLEDVRLEPDTHSSLVKIRLYEGLVVMDLINYSDREMIEEMSNSFTIERDTEIEFSNSEIINRLGIRNVKLKRGEYDFIPADRYDRTKLGTFYISAQIESEIAAPPYPCNIAAGCYLFGYVNDANGNQVPNCLCE